jgi:hypothetical protein
MALVINDSSYAGTWETEAFIIPAIYELDTIEKGVAFLKYGIKKKHTIGTADMTSPLRKRVSQPDLAGNAALTIGARVLEPTDVMAFTTFNPRDLEVHWESESLSEALLSRDLPATVSSYMIMLMMGRAKEGLEKGLHQGSTDFNALVDVDDARFPLQFFDGFIKKLIVDGSYIDIATPVALTAANIIEKMNAAIAEMSTTTGGKALMSSINRFKRLKFAMSVEDAELYDTACAALDFKGSNVFEANIRKHKNFEIVTLTGLPKDTFYFAWLDTSIEGQLFVGMNSYEDMQIETGKVTTYGEDYFAKALWKFDTQIAKPSEFVMYTTKVLADFEL